MSFALWGRHQAGRVSTSTSNIDMLAVPCRSKTHQYVFHVLHIMAYYLKRWFILINLTAFILYISSLFHFQIGFCVCLLQTCPTFLTTNLTSAHFTYGGFATEMSQRTCSCEGTSPLNCWIPSSKFTHLVWQPINQGAKNSACETRNIHNSTKTW